MEGEQTTMAKKEDFAAAGNRVKSQMTAGTARNGQTTATPEERAARQKTGRTQGRKGAGSEHRVNTTLSDQNYLFVSVMAKATGQSMASFINQILDVYQEDYPGTLERAQAFIDAINTGFGRHTLRDPEGD